MGQKKGFKHSEETKQKISMTIKKRPPLPQAFKKGCAPPQHAFRLGHVPWCTGKKLPEMGKKRMGKNNPNWRGGVKEEGGYIWIFKPEHPKNRRNYVKRANLVMEGTIERFLNKNEVVHHRDNNRKNDRIKNLYLCSGGSEHMTIHRNNLNPPPNGKKFQRLSVHLLPCKPSQTQDT